MEYTTAAGVRLQVSRIPRQTIDEFIGAHPMPEPPMKTAAELGIAVFGDIEELLPIWDDPGYRGDLRAYYSRMSNEWIDLIAGAVDVLGEAVGKDEIADLAEFGVIIETVADLLRFVILDDEDLTGVVGLVFYLSTVTPRGIQEALDRFNVTWHGERIVPGSAKGAAMANEVFMARRAARYNSYSWPEFCELPGPEQSTAVAFYQLEMKVHTLLTTQVRGTK